MNVIFFMSDSFRHDNLQCYGPTRVKTPRLDRFAQGACVFDNAYLGSFPTIPNRLDIMSGRFSCIDREWCPLPQETVTLQQILSASGIVTQMIVDNPHLVEMGFNYERGFDAWDWIRGQETDRWKVKPRKITLPADPRKLRSPDFLVASFARNTHWWKGEEDRFVARTVRAACDWLGEHQDLEKFFLYIDTFDPHEPWDAPKKYVDLYDPDYQGDEVIYPHYDFWRNFLTQRELDHTRALYWAEATLVDHWFGVLLDKLDELGMAEDTAVIFVSDHGYLFGEHGHVGKSLISPEKGYYEAIPMYDDIRRTPLMVRLPGQAQGRHIPGLVQTPDLMPTILEMAGLVATETIGGQARTQALQCGVFYTEDWRFQPETIHGKSLMPLLRGEAARVRDIAVASNTLIRHTPVLAKCAIVTEDGWCLHYAGKYDETLRDAKMFINRLTDPQAVRTTVEPGLYHLPSDPEEEKNVIQDNGRLAQEIHERYVAWLQEVGTPREHLAGRRKLQ
jgi:arylsulfatase A-like enzyme